MKIKYQWRPAEFAQEPAQQPAFVQVRVNNVRAATQYVANRLDRQHHIQIQLVARGANDHAIVKRYAPAAQDVQVGHIAPVRISQDDYIVTHLAQHQRFLQNTDVTTVVGEEHSGSQHQDVIRLFSTRCSQ